MVNVSSKLLIDIMLILREGKTKMLIKNGKRWTAKKACRARQDKAMTFSRPAVGCLMDHKEI